MGKRVNPKAIHKRKLGQDMASGNRDHPRLYSKEPTTECVESLS